MLKPSCRRCRERVTTNIVFLQVLCASNEEVGQEHRNAPPPHQLSIIPNRLVIWYAIGPYHAIIGVWIDTYVFYQSVLQKNGLNLVIVCRKDVTLWRNVGMSCRRDVRHQWSMTTCLIKLFILQNSRPYEIHRQLQDETGLHRCGWDDIQRSNESKVMVNSPLDPRNVQSTTLSTRTSEQIGKLVCFKHKRKVTIDIGPAGKWLVLWLNMGNDMSCQPVGYSFNTSLVNMGLAIALNVSFPNMRI